MVVCVGGGEGRGRVMSLQPKLHDCKNADQLIKCVYFQKENLHQVLCTLCIRSKVHQMKDIHLEVSTLIFCL